MAVDRATLSPGSATTFYQAANPDLPDGFVGSAIITSAEGQPLAALVNAVKQGAGLAIATEAFNAGGTMLQIPLVYRDFAGWNSGLQLQNLGSASTTVTVSFYHEDGREAASVTRTVDPGVGWTIYLPDVTDLPSAFVGPAVATSLNGGPLAAMINLVK